MGRKRQKLESQNFPGVLQVYETPIAALLQQQEQGLCHYGDCLLAPAERPSAALCFYPLHLDALGTTAYFVEVMPSFTHEQFHVEQPDRTLLEAPLQHLGQALRLALVPTQAVNQATHDKRLLRSTVAEAPPGAGHHNEASPGSSSKSEYKLVERMRGDKRTWDEIAKVLPGGRTGTMIRKQYGKSLKAARQSQSQAKPPRDPSRPERTPQQPSGPMLKAAAAAAATYGGSGATEAALPAAQRQAPSEPSTCVRVQLRVPRLPRFADERLRSDQEAYDYGAYGDASVMSATAATPAMTADHSLSVTKKCKAKVPGHKRQASDIVPAPVLLLSKIATNAGRQSGGTARPAGRDRSRSPPPPEVLIHGILRSDAVSYEVADRAGGDDRIKLRRPAAAPPPDSTVAAAHCLPNLDAVKFFEEVEVQDPDNPARSFVFDLKEREHCACFYIGQKGDGVILLSWSDLHALYQLPDGTMWAEHGYFNDAEDLESIGQKVGRDHRQLLPLADMELIRRRGRYHSRLSNIEEECWIYYGKIPPGVPQSRLEHTFFWRYMFDPYTLEKAAPPFATPTAHPS